MNLTDRDQPWGTWLTCEENTSGPLTNPNYTQQHGWVFEVPAFGPANPQPLRHWEASSMKRLRLIR